MAAGWSAPPVPSAAGHALRLGPGSVLAERYEILQVLGKGGMGAVFKARDRELDRVVAIKVIRPDLEQDREILQRFKQELILARQITHKNVIRIFDLGQADGIRFITMEHVEGTDLKQLMSQQGKLSPEASVSIVKQICLALEAAHAEGVVHRDLKPQNVMIDRSDRVLVMDFGIARTLESAGATQTGSILGTPEYMSPEQAKAESVDTRSDLFALGIIFYELLTGKFPYKSDTAMGTLLKRIQDRAVPPVDLDGSIPRSLSDIVVKCLAVDREQRYQTASDVLRDLAGWQTPRPLPLPVSEPIVSPAIPALTRLRVPWLAGGLALLAILAVAGYLLIRGVSEAVIATGGKPVSILVADFDNRTSDPVFDGTLEPAFSLAMEGAPFITAYRRGDALKAALQLQPQATRLDATLGRLVAQREGINVVISGSITPRGNGYRVAVKAVDAATDKQIISREEESKSKDNVLASVGRLATPIRKALGDSTPESLQLMAVETFSAGNLAAAHEYARAQALQWAGKGEEAIAAYQKAIELDGNMGRAYAGLAAVNANLGRAQAAEKYYKQAMGLIDHMSDRERYRTLGGYYMSVRNPDKAIEVLSEMVRKYPADSSGFSNLAYAYSLRRDLGRALEMGRKAVEIYPKNLIQRNNVAIYAMYEGEFDTAVREARAVLDANPSFLKAHVVVGLAKLAQGWADQAAEEYRQLEKVSPLGASFAAIGLADLNLYLGRPAEAAAMLEKQAAVDIEAKNNNAAAVKLVALASAELQLGHKAQALAAAEKAEKISSSETLNFQLGRFYVEAGQEAKAGAIAADLGTRVLAEPQAYARLIECELLLRRGNAREAIRAGLEAKKHVDTWIGRLDLGRAYLEAGQFPEAHEELELCLKRRGEATAMLLDEVPSYRIFPALFFYLGRVHDALKSDDATGSYRSYLEIRNNAVGDPMAQEARRWLASR